MKPFMLIMLFWIFGCKATSFHPITEHSHIPYDTLHYYSVVLQPHNGKKTYQVIVKDVYYIPDLKLWLNSKRKPLLRGWYHGAEVFEIKKIK